jgi:metal-responsive CopG/Arc/MetJ family transcriptional regulator
LTGFIVLDRYIYTIYNINMKRTTIWLPEELLKWLQETAKRTGIRQAEIIRRALDEYRQRREKEEN